MKRSAKTALAATVVCLAAILVAGGLVSASSSGRTFSDVSLMPHRKVGLLLGCARKLSDGRPNRFFVHRVAAAARLFNARKVDHIIVSGDNHVAGYDEPTDMKDALVKAGVPENRIHRDFAGFRTLDSVVRAREVFGQSRVTIISQEFHNQRAIYIARNRGIDAVGFNATDVDPRNSFWTRTREPFARVRTVLDVRLLGTGPKFLGERIDITPEARAP